MSRLLILIFGRGGGLPQLLLILKDYEIRGKAGYTSLEIFSRRL